MEKELKPEFIEELEKLLDEEKKKSLFKKILDKSFFTNWTYNKLKDFFFKVEEFYLDLKEKLEKVDLDEFISNTLDVEALKKIYYAQGIDKKYPNLDFDKLKEFFEQPITSLKSPAYKKNIQYDPVVSRKYLIAILQMIFNNMDLVVTFCGREGTGKTTASTQDAYLVYYMLKEVGVVDYDFNLKNIMNYNLKSLTDNFNKWSKNPFRIYILDEGNELNRKEWSNPLVSMFFQKLRRERKHLRIVFINLPQLGELLPSITLSRVNFVFQLSMKLDLKTKLAAKGNCYFYIIPRFPKIYSYLNKRILHQDELINDLGKILDDKKKYLQTLPKYLAVHKFSRNGVWAFNEPEYDKQSKAANEAFSTVGITLSKQEVFYLGKYLNMKKMGVKPNTNAYYTLTHLKNKRINAAINTDDSIAAIGNLDDNSLAET